MPVMLVKPREALLHDVPGKLVVGTHLHEIVKQFLPVFPIYTIECLHSSFSADRRMINPGWSAVTHPSAAEPSQNRCLPFERI